MKWFLATLFLFLTIPVATADHIGDNEPVISYAVCHSVADLEAALANKVEDFSEVDCTPWEGGFIGIPSEELDSIQVDNVVYYIHEFTNVMMNMAPPGSPPYLVPYPKKSFIFIVHEGEQGA